MKKGVLLLILVMSTAVFAQQFMDSSSRLGNSMFQVFDQPTVALEYGVMNLAHKEFAPGFSPLGYAEVKMGYTTQEVLPYGIIDYEATDLSFVFINTDIGGEVQAGKFTPDILRLGINNYYGYGYAIGDGGIIGYNGYGFTWSKMEIDQSFADSAAQRVVDRYGEEFRFGTSSEGGVKVQVIPSVEIKAGYERAAIYERHMFWMWAASRTLEGLGEVMIDEFVNSILDSSPVAAPIVNFLLKNAFSYGVYELRKDQMYWPFDTAPAMITDTYKAGLTFVF